MIRNESLAIATQIRRMADLAMAMYYARYDSTSYLAATTGKSVAYANALIDESLALCGHPMYKVSINRKWGKNALAHLANFAQEEL